MNAALMTPTPSLGTTTPVATGGATERLRLLDKTKAPGPPAK